MQKERVLSPFRPRVSGRRWLRGFLFLAAAFVLFELTGCRGFQQLHEPCTTNACPPCQKDDDCYVLSNPCLSSAQCVPKNSNYAVILIGCSNFQEYVVPDRSRCGCIKAVCRIR